MRNTGYIHIAELAGLLHDCGKFSTDFELYIQDAANSKAKKGKVIHSFAGPYLLLKKFHSNNEIGYKDIAVEIIATAIASHHGLVDVVDEYGHSGFLHRLTAQPEYEEVSIQHFWDECASYEEIEKLLQCAEDEITHFYACLPTPYNDIQYRFYTGLLTRLITSAVVDGDRTDTADFMRGYNLPVIKSDFSLWQQLSDRITTFLDSINQNAPISQARRDFSDACNAFANQREGIYHLDLYTGGGKTISSFRYAVSHAAQYNKNRIFYIAPLLTILEQNASVIRTLVSDDSLVLEHHSNIIHEGESEDELIRYDYLAETWNAPIVITSMVQFLNTLFSGKMSSVRRFHALCNSVIIIDEVQTIPQRDIDLVNLTINFLAKICHATVVLCSATQPCFEATSQYQMVADSTPMIPVSLLNRYQNLFDRTSIHYCGRVALTEMPSIVCEAMQRINSLLVVCNTKKEASELFYSLASCDSELFFLSADLCKAHRKKVLDLLNTALSTGKRLICVSTQVIEAGVDISFQGVIRFLAGLDNIVQSAGRCNRNGEYGSQMPVYVYDIADEKLGNLESIKESQYASRNLICEYEKNPEYFSNNLVSESAVSYYYRCLFKKLEETQGSMEHPLKGQPTMMELLSANGRYTSETPHAEKYYLCQAFRNAGTQYSVFEEDTISVIVPYGEGKKLIDDILITKSMREEAMILEKAKNYVVSVYSNVARKLLQSGAIYSVWDGHLYILSPSYYDPQTGLQIMQRKELMECNTLIW